jgi:hypothetical protein
MQLSRILNWISFPFRKEDKPTDRKERLISSFIRTHAFSKLTVQNKVLALGKLITIFRSDCGFTPASLERALSSLQKKLRQQTHESWDALYSEANFKPTNKRG